MKTTLHTDWTVVIVERLLPFAASALDDVAFASDEGPCVLALSPSLPPLLFSLLLALSPAPFRLPFRLVTPLSRTPLSLLPLDAFLCVLTGTMPLSVTYPYMPMQAAIKAAIMTTHDMMTTIRAAFVHVSCDRPCQELAFRCVSYDSHHSLMPCQ